VNDAKFVSQRGKSRHDLWTDLLKLITRNPAEMKKSCLDVDAIIRGGIRKFPSEVGRLWNSLADFYVRSGHFEKARDVYEEGVNSVNTIRDFSLIFDGRWCECSFDIYLCSLHSARASLSLSICNLTPLQRTASLRRVC
jgi:pentatricopeptide repeat protein